VSSRYERASLIVTSNKPFAKARSSATTCSPAIVDRLTFAGQIIETGTASYRLSRARAARKK
jgi:DNA replication protein DnaC